MKDWTDIVSSRLKDASGEMPNGSWETLASDIAARSRRRRIFGWSGASAAAAANARRSAPTAGSSLTKIAAR